MKIKLGVNQYPQFRFTPVLKIGFLLSVQILFCHNVYAENQNISNEQTLDTIKVKASATTVHPLEKQVDNGALGSKRILDTPFSVTVVGSEDIEKRGAKSIAQILVNEPSFYSPTAANATDWWGASIRGLAVRNYFMDDYPILGYWGGDLPIEAADNVTVLKGLTGFMYGFGSPGGAIRYQTRRPTEQPKTSVSLDYRPSSLFSVMLDTSNTFKPADLKYRFMFATDQGTAYNSSQTNRFVTSLALEKQFNDALIWDANVIYEKNRLSKEPFTFMLDSNYSGTHLPSVHYDYDDVNVDNSYYRTNTLIASTGLNWQINDLWKAKYQFGYTEKNHESNKSFASLNNVAGDYNLYMYNFAQHLESFTNQAMLFGQINTGIIQHDLVFGVGHLKNVTTAGNNSYWQVNATGNLYQPQTFLVSRTPDFSLKAYSTVINQDYGFLSDTLHFSPRWQAILGARYTHYDQEANVANTKGYSTNALTPTFALLYKPTDDMTAYASYVESLEAGSVVGATYINAGDTLDATISKQYELGLKYALDNISLSSAIFRIERSSNVAKKQGNGVYLSQDGLDIYQGLEFNTQVQATDQFNWGFGLVYLDAFKDQLSTANAALAGKTPTGVPQWTLTTRGEYQIPQIAGLSLHADARYNGMRYFDDENTFKVSAYTTVNAGLSYQFKLAKHNAVLNANINNLFNKKYWAAGNYGYFTLGEARNAALSLKMDW
ncbi:TonB-dependent siderophore receptor [Acinetobacter sp. MD2(2019)]|uniref:TonB-dependent siderophore receptor n=1 Tax=Acinetobacter sp. MD2(2019) TaxID=2605273 RepID=UPI002D1E8EBF|nr:TonB-dependent siderophore receptor [Acinetobacter sp. MD2(2019)]MEB3752771.1 TonB-dependent siderophore receptor [Acinetobacter sp. MD2(2019)]